MKKKLFVVCGIFLVMAAAAFIGGNAVRPSGTQAKTVQFEIQPGESASDIASRLHEERIISSKISFMTYAAFTGAIRNLKPGLYSLVSGNIPQIVSMLESGPQQTEIVLFPGMTVAEMDAKLAENGVIKRHALEALVPGDFSSKDYPFLSRAASLEGFLMPDTYKFKQDSDPEAVAGRMLDNFKDKTDSWFRNMRPQDVQRIVNIASIVEKEVPGSADRKIVSGIIYNRLYDNHPLQVDAAVAYGACGGIFAGCDAFDAGSFKKDTPYNTYMHPGLPAHAISNPSPDAIDAALHPARTDYYFYLTDRATGKTMFSTTFEEHAKKRGQYMGI